MGIHGKCSFQRPVYGGWLSFIIIDEDLLDSCHQLFGYPIFQTTLGSRSESPGEFHKDPSYDRDLYGNETFNNQVTMWTGIRWAKRTGFVWKIWGKHHTPLPFCYFYYRRVIQMHGWSVVSWCNKNDPCLAWWSLSWLSCSWDLKSPSRWFLYSST